jgi:twitching motility protein PilT
VFQIYSQMETGQREGMRTMNLHLAELVNSGTVAYDDALARSPDPQGLAALLPQHDAARRHVTA